MKRSNASPILTAAEASFAELHLAVYNERRIVEAYAITIGHDFVVPAYAVSALLGGDSSPALTVRPSVFFTFTSCILIAHSIPIVCARTGTPGVGAFLRHIALARKGKACADVDR